MRPSRASGGADPSSADRLPPVPGRGRAFAWARAATLLALVVTLLIGSDWQHARAGRPADGARPTASTAAEAPAEGACPAGEPCRPDPGAATDDVDCPQSACATILPGVGDPGIMRAAAHHRREWTAPERAAVRRDGRVERPPRRV